MTRPPWDGVLSGAPGEPFRDYATRVERLAFANLRLDIAHLTEFDRLYDELVARGEDHEDVRDERIPYWSELWPCAIAMADHLANEPGLVAGKQVLELGCGAGLAGIAASALGARVLFTDYLGDALAFAGHNWRLNFRETPETCLLDWREPDPELAAEVVLAADIAYEPRAFEPILAALPRLVKPGGQVLLSEENRYFAREFLDALLSLGRDASQEVARVKYRGVTSRVNLVWIAF